ncbi:MAG: hypothetical protein H6Q19_1568 [Bacteroidetes bacterium]|nr:hypothetical protein [Bacteroidota bacterium]
MQIRLLHHHEINYDLWDKCINNAKNSLAYASTWYLDMVSPEWEALVAGDYEYIMPLPVKKKFGIKYIVQPILTQQLGVFSEETIDSEIVNSFIRAIPYFSYELNLNERNFTPEAAIMPNIIVDLNYPYEYLKSNFSVNTKRNIVKAESNQLHIDRSLKPDEFIRLYLETDRNFKIIHADKIRNLICKGSENNLISICCVRTPENEVVSAVGLLKSGNRIIYLLPFSSVKGKTLSAMFFLINELIKEHAGTEKILDFEGSRIEGLNRFYKGFGGVERSYYLIKKCRPKYRK